MQGAPMNGLLASGSATPQSRSAATVGALLRSIIASRGLGRPGDLVSEIGSDNTTTCWKLNAAQTLVVAGTARDATIDDAQACGHIAANAALAPIHAAAAKPLFARMLCECPAGASDAAREAILEGAALALSEAGAILADAQFVDAPTLRFDVLAAGIVRPDRLRSVAGAQAGDALIVAGPLGSGIYATAHARKRLSAEDRDALIAQATRSTRLGIALGSIRNVHAVNVVGPTGLIAAALALGHASALAVVLDARTVPMLPQALALARAGSVSPLSSSNWNRDGALVRLDDRVMPEMRALLTDPHASGALLIACKRESVGRVLALCEAEDVGGAAEVGSLHAVSPDVGGAAKERLTVVA